MRGAQKWLSVSALVFTGLAAACHDQISEPKPSLPRVQTGPLRRASLMTPGDANPFGFYVGTLENGPNPPWEPLWTKGPALLDTLSQNNVGWLRTAINWYDVEKDGPGTDSNGGSLARFLQTLTWIQERGLRAYVQIHFYAPDWASGSLPRGYGPDCSQFGAWEAFVARIVNATYPLGVRHYAIHNEPGDSLTPQFHSRHCMGPGYLPDYEELTRLAARQIHAYSGAKVIYWEQGGGANGDGPPAIDSLAASLPRLAARAAQFGESDPVDIVAVHSYGHVGPNDTFMGIASQVVGDMQAFANRTTKELWLTEFGGDVYGQYAGNGQFVDQYVQRDYNAMVIAQFIKLRPGTWTRLFTFNDQGAYGFTEGLYDNSTPSFTTRLNFWAYGYLAHRYAGDTAVSYDAFFMDNRSWYHGTDGAPAPSFYSGWSMSQGLWGAHFVLNPLMVRAGSRLCAQFHLGFIGWLGGANTWYCDGEWIGPIEFSNQNHELEAFKIRLEWPLPSYIGPDNSLQLCGGGIPKGRSWITSCPPPGFESGVIGTTGQALPLMQLKLWMNNDVR
jgi:hypothetical protein